MHFAQCTIIHLLICCKIKKVINQCRMFIYDDSQSFNKYYSRKLYCVFFKDPIRPKLIIISFSLEHLYYPRFIL